MIRQGIILAGGSGTRLFPYTKYYNKSLVGINGKFVIDYPLATLKQLGVQDLIVVLGGAFFDQIVNYLKDGKELGFNSVSYVYQRKSNGISAAINLCSNLITDEKFLVILGDNIFDGKIVFTDLDRCEAQIVLKSSNDLNRFGVASIKDNKIQYIKEKPLTINTDYLNYAISGLYLFDYHFFEYFKQTKQSDRKEFEIVDIIQKYLDNNSLGFTITDAMWGDAGKHDSIKHLSDYFWNKENGTTQR